MPYLRITYKRFDVAGILIGLGISLVFVMLCAVAIICCKRHFEKRHRRTSARLPNPPRHVRADEQHEMKVASANLKAHQVSADLSVDVSRVPSFHFAFAYSYDALLMERLRRRRVTLTAATRLPFGPFLFYRTPLDLAATPTAAFQVWNSPKVAR